VAAPVDLVVVDEVRVGALRPALRRLVLLAGKDGHGHGDGDALGVEEATLVLPQYRRDAETPVLVSQSSVTLRTSSRVSSPVALVVRSSAETTYRSDRNAARISVANSSGSSQAAKWPPRSTSLK
jgi:hypothetical protein